MVNDLGVILFTHQIISYFVPSNFIEFSFKDIGMWLNVIVGSKLSQDKKTEFLVDTEHFIQSSDGGDDLALMINSFLDENQIKSEDVVDIKYSSHYDSTQEINYYSALLIHRIEVDVDDLKD